MFKKSPEDVFYTCLCMCQEYAIMIGDVDRISQILDVR